MLLCHYGYLCPSVKYHHTSLRYSNFAFAPNSRRTGLEETMSRTLFSHYLIEWYNSFYRQISREVCGNITSCRIFAPLHSPLPEVRHHDLRLAEIHACGCPKVICLFVRRPACFSQQSHQAGNIRYWFRILLRALDRRTVRRPLHLERSPLGQQGSSSWSLTLQPLLTGSMEGTFRPSRCQSSLPAAPAAMFQVWLPTLPLEKLTRVRARLRTKNMTSSIFLESPKVWSSTCFHSHGSQD